MRTRFSTDDLPPRDREPLWRDVISRRMFSLTPADTPDAATFRAVIETQAVGGFSLSDVQTPYRRLRRTAADVARDGIVRFGLSRVPVATEVNFRLSHAREMTVRLAPGDVLIGSSEWAFDTASPNGAWSTMLLIPHERLAPLLAGGRMGQPLVWPAGSPFAALLGSGLATTREQLPRLPPELGEGVLQHLCGLIGLACGASEAARDAAPQAIRAVRLAEARRLVGQHLADPRLSPARVAVLLGVSVRQLHLLFEPTGESFGQHVTRRRLEACRAALTSPAQARRSVLDIALGWGFDSLSTFYRAFRLAYGMAPGELRTAAQAAEAAGGRVVRLPARVV